MKVALINLTFVALVFGIVFGAFFGRLHDNGTMMSVSTNRQYVSVNKTGGIRSFPPSSVAPSNKDVIFDFQILNNAQNSQVDVFWWSSTENKEIFKGTIAQGLRFKTKTYYDHIWTLRNHDDQSFIRSIVADPHVILELVQPDQSAVEEYEQRTGITWNNVFNRGPTTHRFIGGPNVGDIIRIASSHYHWLGPTLGYSEQPLELVLTTRSLEPRVVVIENFMSQEECDELIKTAQETMNADGTIGFQRSLTGDAGIVHEARTSSNTWVDISASKVIENVAARMFQVLGIDPERAPHLSEIFQVLEYTIGQQYKAHEDWFGPHDEENAHYLSVLKGRNRFATFFLYLSDVEEGGATAFPKAKGYEVPDDHLPEEACETGFHVKPRKGSSVVFYSMMPDGNLDERSLHAGCPVKKGIKFAANAWIWDPTRSDLNEPETIQSD